MGGSEVPALAVADKALDVRTPIYAVLSPEGFASILEDGSRAMEAAELMKIASR